MKDEPAGSAAAEWRAHWPLVAAAAAGMSLASVSSFSTGIMIGPIEQELGWTRAQIASGPALISLIAVCLSAPMGMAIDRVGARNIGIISATLLCAALAAMSLATSSLVVWWSLWCLAGLACAAMPTVWTAPVTNLFSAGRGLALAIALSGTGIGSTFVPLIAGYVVENYDWRAGYLALGCVWAILALPLIILFFRDRPTDQRTHAGQAPAKAKELSGLTAREGFRSPALYKLMFAALTMTLAGTAIVVNIVPILGDNGISLSTAAVIAGVTGICTIIGRIIGGYMMDRIPAHWIAAGATLVAILFPVLILAFPGSIAAASIGVAIFALTAGPKTAAIAYLAGRHLGSRSFGTLFGAIHMLMALGVALGPVLANHVYDTTRSYDLVLWTTIPLLIAATIAFLTMGRYPQFVSVEPSPPIATK